MKSPLAFALIVASSFANAASDAPKGFTVTGINLGYQNQEELGRRISVQDLAAYIKRLQSACTDFFTTSDIVEDLDIVVAVGPEERSRVWFVSSRTPATDEKRNQLRGKLEGIVPPKVSKGPIAFCIHGGIAGGKKKPDGVPPTPAEWKQALAKAKSKEPGTFDQLISIVWPEATAKPVASEEFVTQILEPTGGKMPKPKSWFYNENHRGPVYDWTISKEEPSDSHPYTTGVRIQSFAKVKEGTGKTAKQFVFNFVASKKKEAAKVIRSCDEEDSGLFWRICLETEEGPYHILYSLFWGKDDLDLAVIVISGTTKELWPDYAPVFDRMSEFEFIDMTRFK